MKQQTFYLMLEAYRRWTVLHAHETKPVEDQWLGLGYARTYRPAVTEGYLKPFSPERPRCAGWYLPTTKGAELLKRWKASGVKAPESGYDYEYEQEAAARNLV
jgi:hypothetical protein